MYDTECKSSAFRLAPQTRAAIDVGLPKQHRRVVGFDAAAVLDDERACAAGSPQQLADTLADEGMGVLRLLRGRVDAGADRPYRLVGNGDLLQLFGRDLGKRAGELHIEDGFGQVRLAFVKRFADAQDDLELRLERGMQLLVDEGVGLLERPCRRSLWPTMTS